MYSSKKKMTIGRDSKPVLRVPVEIKVTPSRNVGGAINTPAKNFSFNSTAGFTRGVDTNNDAVGFVKEKAQSLPTDFSWDKLMPEKWTPKALQLPSWKEWWKCPSGRTILFGVVGGFLILAGNALTERVSYNNYSAQGSELLARGENQQAISYFNRAAIAESTAMWPGSPRHVAALEGLAVAYERAGYKDSARDTLAQECQVISKSPIRDEVRLASALTIYAECLERQKLNLEAEKVRIRIRDIRHGADIGVLIILIIASLATYSLYAANALLQDKLHLANWRQYFWFTALLYFAFVNLAFRAGASLLPALLGAAALEYVLLPAIIGSAVAFARATAPYWSNALTTPSERSK